MSGVICSECGTRVASRDACEERLEYRAIVSQARFRVVKLRDVCNGCAAVLAAKHRGVDVDAEQLDIFNQPPDRLIETSTVP